jgi:hypothetical protein
MTGEDVDPKDRKAYGSAADSSSLSNADYLLSADTTPDGSTLSQRIALVVGHN